MKVVQRPRHASCSVPWPTTSVLRGTAWVPFNQPGANVGELIDCFAAGQRRADRDPVMLALDPLLDRHQAVQRRRSSSSLIKVVVIFVVGLVGTMLMVWFERKVISGMQNRIGPEQGRSVRLLQTLADGIKLFFKEDLIPDRADRFVFKLAPYLAFVPAFLVWSRHPARRRLQQRQGRHGR